MPDNLRHAQYLNDGTQIDDPQKIKDFTAAQLSAAVSGAGNAFIDSDMLQGAQFWRDNYLIGSAPADYSLDFTAMRGLPASVICSSPNLQVGKGMYIGSAAEKATINLGSVISGFAASDWTVEAEFQLDQARTGQSGRVPVQMFVDGINRVALSFSDTNGGANCGWENIGSGTTQTRADLCAMGQYQQTITVCFGTSGGLGFAAVNGMLLFTGATQTVMSSVPNLILGARALFDDRILFGWIRRVRVWKTRVTDLRAQVLQPTNDYRVICWGDSLTAGSGASSVVRSYPSRLSEYIAAQTVNGGNPGDTSTQVKTRFLAGTAGGVDYTRRFTHVFWVGRNNPSVPATVIADIEAMRKLLPHDRYIVMSVLNKSDGTENSGSGTYNQIVATNAALSAQYGERYVDIRSLLVAASGGANDAPAASTSSDGVHLNDTWYAFVASQTQAKLASLKFLAP